MEKNKEYKIQLKGLTCANCSVKIEERARHIDEVSDANFNFSNEVITLSVQEEADTDRIFSSIKQIVKQIEPEVEVIKPGEIAQEESGHSELIKFALVFIGMVLNIVTEHNFKLPVYIVLYLIAGFEVYTQAFKNILAGDIFDEEFLMSIASLGAFVVGEYPEGISVMLFYAVGEYFQDKAVEKSRKSISSALQLKPDYANVEINGELIKVSPEEVKLDDVIIVKPGEKIPLDGVVVFGNSNLDTSMISGESIPRFVEIGDEVYSGSLNTSTLIKIQVKSTYENTTIAKIVDMVENASSRKSPTEKTITKFSRIYTPIVVGLAVLMAVGAPLLQILDWREALFRACTFLVISCPCAFVISVPLGVFAGIGAASKEGIFVKGGNYLEAMSEIKSIAFDKTGTLTKGVFEVVKVVELKEKEDKILQYAYSAERNSTHPIATAIVAKYNGKALEVENLKDIAGHGLEYTFDNSRILVGNAKLLKKFDIEFDEADESGVIIYVAKENEVIGYIVVADTLKANIKEDIEKLKAEGLKLTLLSGDKTKNVSKVATEVGIYNYQAELLPDEKVEYIEKMISENDSKVAFVGDGVNDAPVLARADLGIAMGSIGSDLAIESADVVLMTDEISKIGKGISISKKTKSIVKQNIALALIVKLTVLVLGFLGFASMWAAVFADVGVTIIAIFNSMRALNTK